ncbi:hypothetical protein BT96DRAFT_1080167 [Gymnopus androsaceus JB14]|uniref:CxC2-like cysteine cluster KDZ transposase-associated domain-containing protein n=1 Tax=Gymnopus androsaceus JB14 TaxID=1447944 RepID=A0A6A4I270_9AGAR|nr:hypothetical protein BT96DRAFT_1080167 [Gymnopus androsaceus JB14]
MEQLHLSTLTTKCSVYDFYCAISKMTDNTNLKSTRWRYIALMRMLLQWRHLKLLKWNGRGNDPSGVAGTKEGDLVVPCLSCPHPGINLAEGWENDLARLDKYSLKVTEDANFRLKEQLVSSHSRDPGLVNGLGYFVERTKYEQYVLSRASEADISTCPLSKFSKGLRYTGVGSVLCARSEMFLANGVGNLQKGEQYANMDYIFGSALFHYKDLPLYIIGYDIACQWFAHIHERSEALWPAKIKLDDGMDLVPVIGKFHEPAHETDNHEQFSCNLAPKVGLMDFEGCERTWDNGLVRGDTLEAHFGFHNWQKYTGTGRTLWNRYRAAMKDRNCQRVAHQGLTNSLPKDLVSKWESICEAWERAPYPKEKAADGSNLVNPFSVKCEYMTQAEVETELVLEDEMMELKGIPFRNQTRPAKFILMGLDLEDSQYKLQLEVERYKNSTRTAHQTDKIVEHQNILKRAFRGFKKLRSVYMPRLVQYLTDLDKDLSLGKDDQPENTKLWLPSLIPVDMRRNMARAYNALDSVRHMLRVKTKMIQFKNKNVRGQRMSGKLREVIDRVHDHMKGFVERYCHSHRGLLLLVGLGNWEKELQVMEQKDMRSYVDPAPKKREPGRRGTNKDEPGMEGVTVENDNGTEEQEDNCFPLQVEDQTRRDGTGETRKEQSWIWLTREINLRDGADENKNEIL